MTVQFSPPVAPMRLGFLSPHNPFERGTFSGTAYFAARALTSRPDISLHVLGPHRNPRVVDRLRIRLLRRPAPQPDVAALDLSGLDAVVGLVASPLLDALQRRSDLPFVHVTDATPAFLRDVYGWDVPAETDVLERRIASRAAAAVYSSDYMARRAQRELGGNITAHSVPFGINFDTLPSQHRETPLSGPLELLFVCSNWVRKGGEMVLNIVNVLMAQGIDVRLTVVGRVPDGVRHPAMVRAGFLDKNHPGQAARLCALYQAAHLMVLPTRGDCTPMVVAEAMAHGTPVLASDTGGMATLIAPGTGAILPLSDGAGDWARAVRRLSADPGEYARTAQRAFTHARTCLTWDGWARGVVKICREATQVRAFAA